AGARRRRHRRPPAGHRGHHAGRRGGRLRGADRRGHAHLAGHRARRRPARQPGPGARGPRPGGAVRARFRDARRRARHRHPGAAPPHRAGAGTADRRPGRRPGAAGASGPGGRPAPVNPSPVCRRDLPRPAPALLVALCAWGVAGAAASFGWLPAAVWPAAGAVLALLALADLAWLWRTPVPDVARHVPEALALGVEREVRLELESGARAVRVDVHDLHPGGWSATGLPRRLSLAPGMVSAVGYRLRPGARGDFDFDGVHLLLHSPLRLWRRRCLAGAAQRVRVFPDFAPLSKLALVSAERASRMMGAHIRRRRGEGTDFHQMREYRVGDSLRQIDWKATSRARKLISREYQDEQNQQLVVVLD